MNESLNRKEDQHHKDEIPYVLVRSANSGCHVGYLRYEEGDTVELSEARRLWYWSGAASLSQIAVEGVKNIQDSKFTMPVNIKVLGVCEIIPVTEVAKEIIDKVKIWKQ
jgi:hypothetical protein